ncbi:MAG: J domain-containing protein [Bacteroidota bacterium]
MGNVEKSSVVVQKEQELLQLQKKRKKLLTQLKRNQTTLEKLKTGITKMQRQVAGRVPDLVMEIQRCKDRLVELFRKAKTSKKIAEEEKEGLDEFIEVFDEQNPFEMLFGMSMEDFEAQREQAGHNTDEFDRQKAFEFFKEFETPAKEEDQREIRKAFIRLANRFHPDKAKSNKEKEQFHELMQQINSAYQRHDLATLIRLEEQYSDKKTLMEQGVKEEGAIIDILDIEIDRISREVQLLDNQLNRAKEELKSVRASDVGKAYKMEQDAMKYGEASSEEMIESLEQQKEELEEVEKAMQVYLKTGEMPELIRELFFLDEEYEEFDEANYFMDDGGFLSVEDLLGAFEDLMDDYEEEEPPQKRKTGKR